MKRVFNALVVSILAFSAFGVMSCKDAIVDDGTNIKSYVSSSGGAGGAVPFHMYNDKMDFQIWTDYNASCTTSTSGGELVISQTGDWYGVAICSNSSGNDDDSKYAIYDLSEIATITFEAKSDTDGSTLKFSACTEDAQSYQLSTEYETYEYDMSKAAHAKTGKHYCIVSLVQNVTKDPIVHYIKNIAFFDASGNEIVPTVSK